jgi:hypothetical protein
LLATVAGGCRRQSAEPFAFDECLMSLLRDIRSAAIDGESDLETLLRKCRVLAARLKLEEFRNWVQWELDGYPAGVDLPDYRKFHCQCFGHFSGPFGSGIRNAPIPESLIPKDLRDILTYVQMRDSVAGSKISQKDAKMGPYDLNGLLM